MLVCCQCESPNLDKGLSIFVYNFSELSSHRIFHNAEKVSLPAKTMREIVRNPRWLNPSWSFQLFLSCHFPTGFSGSRSRNDFFSFGSWISDLIVYPFQSISNRTDHPWDTQVRTFDTSCSLCSSSTSDFACSSVSSYSAIYSSSTRSRSTIAASR